MSAASPASDPTALRIQELAHGLKVRDVMTRKVFAVTRTCTMRDVQAIMKANGISGVPVVDGAHVVGIISMNDIMNAFVDGHMDCSVARCMAHDVQTLSDEVPLTFAMAAFSKYSFRRFPVVNQKNELVGIITPRNINLVLIQELSRQLDELEDFAARPRERERARGFHRLFRLARYDFECAGQASAVLKRELKARGVLPQIVRRAAIASYELEINVVAHSHGGTFAILIERDRVRITANDYGPGIPDVGAAMTEGFSTANDWIRSQGFGAGMGLPNARRVSDEFEIRSGVEMGTMVKSIVYLQKEEMDENQ